MPKETMLSDTREFRRFIREAVIKFDEENCLEEVEEILQVIMELSILTIQRVLQVLCKKTGNLFCNKVFPEWEMNRLNM